MSKFTLARCIGKKSHHLQDDTNWYGIRSKSVLDDTRCEYCKQHIDALGIDYGFHQLYKYSNIDCDSINDLTVSGMTYNGFDFKITNPEKTVPFLVHPESASKRDDGLLVVEMPPIQDYVIHIKNTSNNTLEYYTAEVTIGNRKVVINNNERIYFKNLFTVQGFVTGDNQGFRFVANSQKNVQDTSKHLGENPDSNIILIKIDVYNRHLKPPPVMYDRKLFYNTSRNAASFDDYGSEYESSREKAPRLQQAFIGGRTDTSGRYVEKVQTVKTTDLFTLKRSFAVTIQLINVPTSYQAEITTQMLQDVDLHRTKSIEKIKLAQEQDIARQKALLLLDKTEFINEPKVENGPKLEVSKTEIVDIVDVKKEVDMPKLDVQDTKAKKDTKPDDTVLDTDAKKEVNTPKPDVQKPDAPKEEEYELL